jgi:hypothetical protein
LAEITQIGQVRKRHKKLDSSAREERLLIAIDDLVHAFWDEGVRLKTVSVDWTDTEDYIREALGEQR